MKIFKNNSSLFHYNGSYKYFVVLSYTLPIENDIKNQFETSICEDFYTIILDAPPKAAPTNRLPSGGGERGILIHHFVDLSGNESDIGFSPFHTISIHTLVLRMILIFNLEHRFVKN